MVKGLGSTHNEFSSLEISVIIQAGSKISFHPISTHMATLKELLAQQQALEAQINEARKSETADAIAKVRSLVADFGLTADEVFNNKRTKTPSTAGSKVAAKYLDPVTGNTWTGRGKAPRWLDGKDRSQYLIK